MDESLYTSLFARIARKYNEDVAQEAILATLKKSETTDIKEFTRYAWRCAYNFWLIEQTRPSGLTGNRVTSLEGLAENGEHPTVAPEQATRAEARQLIERAHREMPSLVDHLLDPQGPASSGTKTRWHRFRKAANNYA